MITTQDSDRTATAPTIELELFLLAGLILAGNTAAARIARHLTVGDFETIGARAIFQALVHLIAGGTPVDALSIATELERRAAFTGPGGQATTKALLDAVAPLRWEPPLPESLAHHAAVLVARRYRAAYRTCAAELDHVATDEAVRIGELFPRLEQLTVQVRRINQRLEALHAYTDKENRSA